MHTISEAIVLSCRQQTSILTFYRVIVIAIWTHSYKNTSKIHQLSTLLDDDFASMSMHWKHGIEYIAAIDAQPKD